MATSTTSPSSPLRAEDLLSDSSEAPGLNQVSSEVTSQLYASLHLSRQAEATARAQLYLPSTSPPPHEELDSLAQELSRSLSVGLENNLKKKDGSKHIFEMESVRGQLQSMLQTSRDTAYRDSLAPGAGSARREEDSFDSDSTATLLNTRPLQDLSPSSSAQALEELFPRYTSLRPGPPLNPPDFQGLRDALDSEHTRRKHCERHIQSLQTRVLELQQQLAVAVTADRKKDIMIEQLDKTLAHVVEGWNRHEAERTEVLRGLQEERQAAELTRSKQQETVTRLEQSLSEAMEALNREQESARLQQQERETLEEERQALTLSFELEQQRCRALQEELDEARAGQLSERRQLETLQVALEGERQTWAQQERQLKERYQALQEEGQVQLEREKGNTQREVQVAREAQQQLALMQSEVRRLEGDLDTARRERDALQLEMSLVQARYESQRIQLESELAVQLEQRVTERLAQAQESSLRQAASLREHHRKQLQDLNGQHQQELSTQLSQFKVEMAEREERQQQVAQDYELRLAREQARVRELQSGNQQLEEQRTELVERLQAMLQAHWEEANQLLGTSTLPPNPPVPTISPSSPGPQEPEKGERRVWTMPPVAVALKPVLQKSREARDELPGVPPVLCSPSPDLSLLLDPSFQNQHSFQPLEPKPDLTSSSAGAFSSAVGAFHPNHRAERPFPEEDPGSDGDGFLKQGLLPPSQMEGLKHFLHQLLETVPQNNENPSVELLPPKSGSLTVPSWEEAPQVPRLPPPVHKTKVPLAMASSLLRVHELPSTHSQSSVPSSGSPERGRDGVASSKHLMEVSQLLRLYQARGWEALPAEDLLLYLKKLEHSGTDSRGDDVPRRNTDFRLGEIPRKEITSQALPRRFATAPKTEKPPARKKSGHPAPSSMRSRGGIWK
ncbi:PREDICTED: centrobin isoform X1 [Hipposideros armiger]|uniref:Centrobin isoform X1 n=2 Tax=Hipposideros armiger TaxID=186990 RepID=A0A8B7TC40_HIPAR|nr:PREDICTED: centrobin isoform X1 [Hipposideros armiger]XP_019521474.1 PREDICTED: centrobin isoform X1 [Hipposideros armiger]XP_019521475.1 PREDICTED: centrobin isoform X1 [Hipposideros armiger]